jgi:hypothetical protein
LVPGAFLICVILIAGGTPAYGQDGTARADSVQKMTLLQVVELYESGKVVDAEHQALKMLDEMPTLSRSEQAELYRVLAFCAIANDDETNGLRHFISALRLNPNLSADPISWSPKIRRIFDQARTEWTQIARAYVEREVSKEAELCRQATLANIFLPGRGQFRKGHTGKGWLHSTLFWSAAAIWLYAEVSLPAAHKSYQDAVTDSEIRTKYNDYRTLSRVAIGSGMVILSVYSYSFLDALWTKPSPSVMGEE